MTRSESIPTAGIPVIDVASLPQPPAWTLDALCAQVDNDAFFPEKGGSTREAKSICAQCPVTRQCLEYALETEAQFGIWGGLSPMELRQLRHRTGATS